MWLALGIHPGFICAIFLFISENQLPVSLLQWVRIPGALKNRAEL
jgi:hypothetical protein